MDARVVLFVFSLALCLVQGGDEHTASTCRRKESNEPNAACQEYDPEKICYPLKNEFFINNMETGNVTYITMDFERNMVGVLGINFNFHLIRSWNNLTGYQIYPDGRCEKYPVPADAVYDRCLPPTARYLGSSFFGINGALPVTSWEFMNMGRKIVGAFTNVPGEPNVPVVRKAIGDIEAWSYSFSGWNTTISNPSAMAIPGNCVDRVPKPTHG